MDEMSAHLRWGGEERAAAPAASYAKPIIAPAELSEAWEGLDAKLSDGEVLGKRIVDTVVAVTLLLAFCPAFLIIAGALRREAGAILVGHRRIGKNGKEFKVYKFRTMVPDADRVLRAWQAADPEAYRQWEAGQNPARDPRVTRLGRLLRKTNLDRLPMLWNVLRGDMSMVGPKPVDREELRKYGSAARYYLARKPGLTGLWYVALRSSRDDYRSRVAMDRCYALTASLWLDSTILFKTVYLAFDLQQSRHVKSEDLSMTPPSGASGKAY